MKLMRFRTVCLCINIALIQTGYRAQYDCARDIGSDVAKFIITNITRTMFWTSVNLRLEKKQP